MTSADASTPADAVSAPIAVYVGTYTKKKSKGIYLFRLDPTSGSLTPRGLAAETTNPSFLALHPNCRYLYAVSEISDFGGKKSGGVSSFSIDDTTGYLTRLNQQPSGGVGPCYVTVDPAGRNVLVANYSSGSVAALPVDDDGKLREPSATIQHTGSSIDPKRQTKPHAHSINLDPSGRIALAVDLGIDKVMLYRLDSDSGTLTPHDPESASIKPGGGARHLAFHPNGRFAYVNHEMGDAVTAFAWDADLGTLTPLGTVSTLPAGFTGDSTTAEVLVHPSGRFLYVSNRGHDSLAIFRIDPESGTLTPIGHEPTQGKTPRGFAIDPTGRYLIVANQESDNLVVFRIDAETGKLEATGPPHSVGTPVCVRFMPQD